jgi:hypothetical protein
MGHEDVMRLALYWLDPAGIGGGAGPRASFAEAFFFSVQTLGSIGFGVLHPVSLYANLLVTAESLCGLLFVAITTGLAFARFARSNARIRRPGPLAGGAAAFRLLLRRHPGRPTQRRRQGSAAPDQLGGLRPDPPQPAAVKSWASAEV